jgi:Flp pilus assembly protein TadG
MINRDRHLRRQLDGGAATGRAARRRRQQLARRRGERGFTALLVAILALVLVGFAGLAVDLSRVYTASQQLQAAADAAALGAVGHVVNEIDTSDPGNPFTLTRSVAVNVALHNSAAGAPVQLAANPGNAADGDVVVGYWDTTNNTFTPDLIGPNAVKVTARRTTTSQGGPVDLIFGPAFAANTADVGRSAIAVMAAALDPLILVLHPTSNASLKIGGNGTITVSQGAVQVNSDANCAVRITGSAHIASPKLATCGTACAGAGSITGPLQEHAPYVEDPLKDLLPDTGSWNAFRNSLPKPLGASGKITATGVYNPGYYPKGLSINNSTTISLSPGTYVFGETLDINGGARLEGDGVTILIDKGAKMNVIGGATLDLGPPTSGLFEGVTIFSHRENSATDAVNLAGNGVLTIDGTVYVPGGTLAMTGTSVKELGGIICWKADFWGNGVITGKDVPMPEMWSSVYLVQ